MESRGLGAYSTTNSAAMGRPLLARRPLFVGHLAQRCAPEALKATMISRRLPQAAPAHALAESTSSSLATYRFPQRQSGAGADWFQQAVRDIVKRVEGTPFLQLVQLGGMAPKFTTVPVPNSVVPVPELWQGIAEHLSSGKPDVVILVQQVNPSRSHPAGIRAAAADEAAAWAETAGQPSESGDLYESPAARSSSSSRKPRVKDRVEAAYTLLVQSGVADSLLTGKVGDCCDGTGHGHSEHKHSSTAASHTSLAAPLAAAPQQGGSGGGSSSSSSAIGPFLSAAPRRRAAVRASAIRAGAAMAASLASAGSSCSSDTCYYGVVVQSPQQQTGVEGCYLLKTVRNVSPTGCACTHFSLTRVCQGEHLEEQFINSWLV